MKKETNERKETNEIVERLSDIIVEALLDRLEDLEDSQAHLSSRIGEVDYLIKSHIKLKIKETKDE